MGKPSVPRAPENDDAVSLHTQPGDTYLDDDAPELQVDDLPPLYDEVAGEGDSSSSAPLLPTHASAPPPIISPYYKDTDTGVEYYISEKLDNGPKFLEQRIEEWGTRPPRVSIRIHGTHKETVDKAGKKEKQAVTDFDVSVDLTPYLYSDYVHGLPWEYAQVNTAENTDKVRRGTILRKRAPEAKQGVELGLPDKPTLEEWCHRYCASHTGIKCLTLQRRMPGFDYKNVKDKIEAMVRNTNYHGSLSITFPVKDEYVHVYNECKTNAWRLNRWIKWLFYLTFLWLFTWPYLFFRTKRFEVLYADWPFSVILLDGPNAGAKAYASISEDHWYNMWGRALSRAVLEKRQCTLNQHDLLQTEAPVPVHGHAAVDGAMSFIRAGIGAMNEVNRQLGWGYDT